MSRNDITGDLIKSRPGSSNFRDNWDAIFKPKKVIEQQDNHQENEPGGVNSDRGSQFSTGGG